MGCDSGSDFHGGIVGVGGIVQWRRVVNDGIIVEVMEVVGVEGSRVLFERYRPPRDTVLRRQPIGEQLPHDYREVCVPAIWNQYGLFEKNYI